ncbi:hypothetical protein ACFL6C_08740 [Myxococcota bacterium]
MAKITIYGKAGSPNTKAAIAAYKEKANYVDVENDAAKLEEMLKHSGGVRRVPVIVKEEEEEVIVGHEGSS